MNNISNNKHNNRNNNGNGNNSNSNSNKKNNNNIDVDVVWSSQRTKLPNFYIHVCSFPLLRNFLLMGIVVY